MERLIYFGGPFSREIQTNYGTEQRAFGGVIYLHGDPDQFIKHVESRMGDLESGTPTSQKHYYFNPAGILRPKVSTDEIITVIDLKTTDMHSLGTNLLRGMPKEYKTDSDTIRNLQGTVLVAGEQFGKGSSREQAVIALQKAGITAVIAPSFGPVFRGNADNLGLLTSTDMSLAAKIDAGEGIPLDAFLKGRSELSQAIIKAGGLIPFQRNIKNAPFIKTPNKELEISRPMNVLEKRLSRITGIRDIRTGDVVMLPVDAAASYVVLSGLAIDRLQHEYGSNINLSVMPMLFEDHFPNDTHPGIKDLTAQQREFAKVIGLPATHYHYGRRSEGGGDGIIHRQLTEKIDPRSTQVITITDSHTPTLGALPLLALPVGSTNFAAAITEGQIPFSTPSVIRIELSGTLPPGTTIRDAQLAMAHDYKKLVIEGLIKSGTVIEFGGVGMHSLRFEHVVALCNMIPENFNAEIAVTERYQAGIDYLVRRFGMSLEEAENLYDTPDPNCEYEGTLKFNLYSTTPCIALPGDPTNVRQLSELDRHPIINKAYIASCTNGLGELREAAAVLKGKKIAEGTTLVIIPSSQTTADQAENLGYLEILRQAGAEVVAEISCGPCIGDGPHAVRENETAISATNRNFPGRMDPSKKGQIYLAGSLITALSALYGRIPTAKEYHLEIERINYNLKEFDKVNSIN